MVPPLLFGLRLWVWVCLALYRSFWLKLDNAHWAGTSAALVSQPELGASLRKGWFRMLGTIVGAVAAADLHDPYRARQHLGHANRGVGAQLCFRARLPRGQRRRLAIS